MGGQTSKVEPFHHRKDERDESDKSDENDEKDQGDVEANSLQQLVQAWPEQWERLHSGGKMMRWNNCALLNHVAQCVSLYTEAANDSKVFFNRSDIISILQTVQPCCQAMPLGPDAPGFVLPSFPVSHCMTTVLTLFNPRLIPRLCAAWHITSPRIANVRNKLNIQNNGLKIQHNELKIQNCLDHFSNISSWPRQHLHHLIVVYNVTKDVITPLSLSVHDCHTIENQNTTNQADDVFTDSEPFGRQFSSVSTDSSAHSSTSRMSSQSTLWDSSVQPFQPFQPRRSRFTFEVEDCIDLQRWFDLVRAQFVMCMEQMEKGIALFQTIDDLVHPELDLFCKWWCATIMCCSSNHRNKRVVAHHLHTTFNKDDHLNALIQHPGVMISCVPLLMHTHVVPLLILGSKRWCPPQTFTFENNETLDLVIQWPLVISQRDRAEFQFKPVSQNGILYQGEIVIPFFPFQTCLYCFIIQLVTKTKRLKTYSKTFIQIDNRPVQVSDVSSLATQTQPTVLTVIHQINFMDFTGTADLIGREQQPQSRRNGRLQNWNDVSTNFEDAL